MAFVIVLLLLFSIWKLYEIFYYKSEKFIAIKSRISSYVLNCNELNSHIETLKNTHLGVNQLDYGNAAYHDNSQWNYRRPELNQQRKATNIYDCSRSVCDNASKQPFKYICKYFNLKANEETLNSVEEVLNNFEAVEQGKQILKAEKENILNSINNDIPFLIRTFSKKNLEKNLGFRPIDLTTTYFPHYIFKYVSSGGYASTQCDIVMNIENLNRFIKYLSEVIKFKKSVAGQRALMTSSLRKQIMKRDNYTCQICGVSTYKEPNLLLEIDHIIPVSRGGLTTEQNLRTLCWKCNRKKGAKLEAISTNNTPKAKDIVNNSLEQAPTNNDIEKLDLGSEVTHILKEVQTQKALEHNKEESDSMYDVDKGIYPAGEYIIGEEIPIGQYILKQREGSTSATVSVYKNYQSYQKDENDSLSYKTFTTDYHISLRTEGQFLVVEDADLQKI